MENRLEAMSKSMLESLLEMNGQPDKFTASIFFAQDCKENTPFEQM